MAEEMTDATMTNDDRAFLSAVILIGCVGLAALLSIVGAALHP